MGRSIWFTPENPVRSRVTTGEGVLSPRWGWVSFRDETRAHARVYCLSRLRRWHVWEGNEDVATPKPFPVGEVSRWASSGSGSGSGLSSSLSSSLSSNRILHFGFDSDGDTDPDPDAGGEGSGPGSSSFLIVSARHVADGEPARNRD